MRGIEPGTFCIGAQHWATALPKKMLCKYFMSTSIKIVLKKKNLPVCGREFIDLVLILIHRWGWQNSFCTFSHTHYKPTTVLTSSPAANHVQLLDSLPARLFKSLVFNLIWHCENELCEGPVNLKVPHTWDPGWLNYKYLFHYFHLHHSFSATLILPSPKLLIFISLPLALN